MTQQTVAHATNGHLTHHVAKRVYIRSLILATSSTDSIVASGYGCSRVELGPWPFVDEVDNGGITRRPSIASVVL